MYHWKKKIDYFRGKNNDSIHKIIPSDSFNSERTYSEKVITYIKNNILGERNE